MKTATRKAPLTFTAIAVSFVALTSCNVSDKGGLKVAGGTIDGTQGEMKYPGTVYVEMNGVDFNNQPKVIRNVGTIVDVGLPGQHALILSLADVLVNSAGRSILPIFKSVTLKLYLSDGQDSITLPGMNFTKEGYLKDEKGRSYLMVAVGLKAEKIGNSDIPENAVRKVTQRLFIESPLTTEKGRNLRDPHTSYLMISVPKDSHPAMAALVAPKMLVAENRPEESSLNNLQVVGFGENIVGGERRGEFALSSSLPSVMKRNYADIQPLNKTPTEYTPLRKLIGNVPAVVKQVWEFTGSGLCGSKDGSNYDTGASVYADGKFVGFAVRSTAKSSGYRGKLECGATSRDDMATLVVSPNNSALQFFITNVK